MRKFILLLTIFMFTIAKAQNNGLNPIVNVQFCDLEYHQPSPEENLTVKNVLNTVTDVIDGKIKDTEHGDMVPAINAMIRSELGYVHRFNCVDMLIDGERNYTITGEITELSTTSKREVTETTSSKGKIIRTTSVRYDGVVSFTLTITNLSNNRTTTDTFRASGYSDGDLSSANKALTAALNRMSTWVYGYYNAMYPVHANIIELSEVKKDKVKELYIDAGRNIGLYKGIHFDVYELTEVAGREVSKKIGRLKIEEVSGDDISLCKVQRGSKEIKAAYDAKRDIRAKCKE